MDSGGGRPCIEVEPSKYIVVVGPRLAEIVLSEAAACKDAKLPALSLTEMVNEGISVLLDKQHFQTAAERAECERVYKSAFQADPLPKLLSNLQHRGGYATWLERCFQLKLETSKTSPTLERLLELQNDGALIVYTGCDDSLSRLANQHVFLLADDFTGWVNGEKKGFMNVHGVYWKPETLQLQCEGYIDPNHPSRTSLSHLDQLFQQRSVIAFGTCDPADLANPMLAAFARTFLFTASSNVTSRQYRFHLSLDSLSSGSTQEYSRCVLNLPQFKSPFKEHEKIGWTIVPMRGQAKMLYEELDLPSGGLPEHHMLSLLVHTKRGASEVSKMTFDSPGANFALVSSVSTGIGHISHTVTLRVEAAKLSEFWNWLWVEKREGLVKEGLLAVIMQTGAIVWCQAKTEGQECSSVDMSVDSPQEVKYSQQLRESGAVAMEVQQKQEHFMELDSGVSATSSCKFLSPLVTQEFPIPKPGGKVIPRYTIQRCNMKSPGGRSSFTLPANALSSSVYSQQSSYLQGSHKPHHLATNDDTIIQGDRTTKNVLGRRSSLPQHFLTSQSGSGSDSKLSTLAEHCQSSSSTDFPPSYAAIKQALLCDYNKRRQSVQSDPKTLKNLLKTKLVISEESSDLVNMRRKSDPGSYVKQRDFERRKELFLDENLSWSKSYGKVIDQQIDRWQQKRKEKQLQREILNWQAQAAASASLSQLQLQMLNPLIAGQTVHLGDTLATVNPAAAATSLFPGNLGAGGMVPPFFPQTVLPNAIGTAAPSPPIYYNPLSSYALLNPYAATGLQQLGPVQAAPTAGTYFMPGTAMAAPGTQPKVLYYVPQPVTTNSSSPLSASSSTMPNPYSFPIHTVSPSSLTPTEAPLSSNNSTTDSSTVQASTSSPPRISLNAPPTHQNSITWLTDNTQFGTELHKLQPMSPNNRKRHQSVPEKLTSLLQPPPPPSIPSAPLSTSSLSSGRSSPMDEGMEGNPDSPPLSKKQRSTSDTTVYHSSYRLPQLSPARGRSPTPHSQGSSPQPPHGSTAGATSLSTGAPSLLEGGLSPLQAHLLQVHQSYGISRSAVEERNKRRHKLSRDKRGHSPLRKLSGGSLTNGRKHSGGSLNNGSMSPTSSLIEEGPITEDVSDSLSRHLLEGKRETVSDMEEREAGSETGSEQGSCNETNSGPQTQLWHFLLDLLISSNPKLLHWTDNEFEFRITRPVEVAQLWGQFTNVPGVNYEQLLSGINAYSREGILSQVQDRKLTFRFSGQVKDYVRMRRLQMANSEPEEDRELVVVVE